MFLLLHILDMDNTVTVLSMNVRGLFSSVKKRNDVFDWAKGKNTSIVCFQETHSSKEVDDGYSRNISCALN